MPVCTAGTLSLVIMADVAAQKKACAEMVHPFEEIISNQYVGFSKPKTRRDDFSECYCHQRGDMCTDDSCANRAVKEECSKRCQCGDDCNNRRMQRREYADVYVFDAGPAGRGLKAGEALPAGSFIMEYVGEIITIEEMEARAIKYPQEGLKHRYFLILDDDEGVIVDSQKKANWSRYINHSCDPNCHMEKWRVGSEDRMAVYTVKNVAAGEELTFDYKWERMGDKPTIKCYCGTAKCRGWVDYYKPQTKKVMKKISPSSSKYGGPGGNDDTYALQQQNINEKDQYRQPTKAEMECGGLLVGASVRVWFKDNKVFFNGKVMEYNAKDRTHHVRYDYDLKTEKEDLSSGRLRWELRKDSNVALQQPQAKNVGRWLQLSNLPAYRKDEVEDKLTMVVKAMGVRGVPMRQKKDKRKGLIGLESVEFLKTNSQKGPDWVNVKLVYTYSEGSKLAEDAKRALKSFKVEQWEVRAFVETEDPRKTAEDLTLLWPKEVVEEAVEEIDDVEVNHRLFFPFRIKWHCDVEKNSDFKSTRRQRLITTIKQYVDVLKSARDAKLVYSFDKLPWKDVVATASLCCLRYVAVAQLQKTVVVDTTQLAISSLVASLKYLGFFYEELWDSIATAYDSHGSMDELRRMESGFAKMIYFDVVNPVKSLLEFLKGTLQDQTVVKKVQPIAIEVIRCTSMEPLWLSQSLELLFAGVLIVSVATAKLLYPTKIIEAGFDDYSVFDEDLYVGMRLYGTETNTVVERLLASAGMEKALKKFADKDKLDANEISLQRVAAVVKKNYTLETIVDSSGKRKARLNDEKLPPFDQIEIKTKPEKLVGTKLWTKENGSRADALHELQVLRLVQKRLPPTCTNIWKPEQIIYQGESDTPINAVCLTGRGSGHENLVLFLKNNKEAPMSLLVDIGKQIVSVVGECLKAGVLHCRLSPENVYVSKQGATVTVRGFGSSLTHRRREKIAAACKEQWELFERWRTDRKKYEEKLKEAKESSDKGKEKMMQKELVEIKEKGKEILRDSLKKFDVVSEHSLSHIAPEILMGSQVHTEESEAWSLGCLLFFLFSRGKLFAAPSKKGAEEPDEKSGIDDLRKAILNVAFSRCSREKLPKETRSYPGRMNVSEKPDGDKDKFYKKMLAWLQKGLGDDDLQVVERVARVIHDLLQIAPRNRMSIRKLCSGDFFGSDHFKTKYVSEKKKTIDMLSKEVRSDLKKRKLDVETGAFSAKKGRYDGLVGAPSAAAGGTQAKQLGTAEGWKERCAICTFPKHKCSCKSSAPESQPSRAFGQKAPPAPPTPAPRSPPYGGYGQTGPPESRANASGGYGQSAPRGWGDAKRQQRKPSDGDHEGKAWKHGADSGDRGGPRRWGVANRQERRPSHDDRGTGDRGRTDANARDSSSNRRWDASERQERRPSRDDQRGWREGNNGGGGKKRRWAESENDGNDFEDGEIHGNDDYEDHKLDRVRGHNWRNKGRQRREDGDRHERRWRK